MASASVSPAASAALSPALVKPIPKGQTLYVLNSRGTITEYLSGSDGNIEPSVTISGELTGLSNSPKAIALDSRGNIYVATENSVLEFRAGGAGNVTPMSIIHGPATRLESPTAITVDTRGNIYVATIHDEVLEFSASSSGDAAPEAAVGSDRTQALQVGCSRSSNAPARALAVGPNNALILRWCFEGSTLANLRVSSGEELWTLSGSLTGLRGSGGIALDSAGNVWAANYGGLMKYPAGSSGNATPTNLIYGPATHYSGPGALAVDAKGDVYVASGYPGSVVEYNSRATGNVAPITLLSGSDTKLESPVGIAVGP